MTSSEPIHVADADQTCTIDVYPGQRIALHVDVEETIDSGGLIELDAQLVEQLIVAWQQTGQRLLPDAIPAHQRPASLGAWNFLTEFWNAGMFTVAQQPDGSYVVTFADAGEAIPLRDMAYNNQLGLFCPSWFPNASDDSTAQ